MILLFEDKVANATFTSLNASLNYPAENLQNQILRKRYQSSIESDTITITFSGASTIKDFWYAFTNATSLELRLYSGLSVLLHTITISSPQAIDAYHFTAVEASYAEIDIAGSTGVYLGGVGLGSGVTYPDPLNAWEENYIDNSVVATSRAGQTLQDYVEPLKVNNWTFREIDRDDMNSFKTLYKNKGIGKPLWVDLFEGNHDFLEPIYASIGQPIVTTKNGRKYNFNINMREAR